MHINNNNYSRCHNNIIQPPWLCGGPKNLASLSQHLILGLLHIQPEQGFGTGEGGSNVWLLSFGGPNEDFKVQECQKSWPHLSIEGGKFHSRQASHKRETILVERQTAISVKFIIPVIGEILLVEILSVCKSNRLHVDILRFFHSNLRYIP